MAISRCMENPIDERGYEIYDHGTTEFPVGCYYDDITENSVPWHWHEEYELVLVEKGVMICAANGQKYTIHEGEGVFVNGGVLHAYWNGGTGSCFTQALVFHPSLVGGSPNSVFWQRYLSPFSTIPSLQSVPIPCQEAWQMDILRICQQGWDAIAKDTAGYEFIVREGLSRMIFLLGLHHSEQEMPISQKELRERERVKVMLQWIHEHLDKPLSVKEIGAAASVSESECLRCFQSVIGKSPIRYLKEYRIQKAAGLLASTQLPVSEVAGLCGFQEMSYFARSFRQLRDCTPSEYRRQCRSSE